MPGGHTEQLCPPRHTHTHTTGTHTGTHAHAAKGATATSDTEPQKHAPTHPTPGMAAETICSLCRLGSCKGGLRKGGGRDARGAGAAKAWLAQKLMRFNLDNCPSIQLLQRLGRGWEEERDTSGRMRHGAAVLREVMLGVASAVSPTRTRPHERRFWLETAIPLCTHSSWPASLSTLLPPAPIPLEGGWSS